MEGEALRGSEEEETLTIQTIAVPEEDCYSMFPGCRCSLRETLIETEQ